MAWWDDAGRGGGSNLVVLQRVVVMRMLRAFPCVSQPMYVHPLHSGLTPCVSHPMHVNSEHSCLTHACDLSTFLPHTMCVSPMCVSPHVYLTPCVSPMHAHSVRTARHLGGRRRGAGLWRDPCTNSTARAVHIVRELCRRSGVRLYLFSVHLDSMS